MPRPQRVIEGRYKEETGIHQAYFRAQFVRWWKNKLGNLSMAPASPRASSLSLVFLYFPLHFSADRFWWAGRHLHPGDIIRFSRPGEDADSWAPVSSLPSLYINPKLRTRVSTKMALPQGILTTNACLPLALVMKGIMEVNSSLIHFLLENSVKI